MAQNISVQIQTVASLTISIGNSARPKKGESIAVLSSFFELILILPVVVFHSRRHQSSPVFHRISLVHICSVLSPNHFINYTDITLNDLYDFVRYILICIVRHRNSSAIRFVLYHLNCCIYSLQ